MRVHLCIGILCDAHFAQVSCFLGRTFARFYQAERVLRAVCGTMDLPERNALAVPSHPERMYARAT